MLAEAAALIGCADQPGDAGQHRMIPGLGSEAGGHPVLRRELGESRYPARAGGPWLCKVLVLSLFRAVVVPSGLSTRVHPHRWMTTW